MNTLVVVNGTDITPYINWKTYKMEREDLCSTWRDGNYVEHRIYARSHLKGKFDVWLCGMNDIDTDAFLELWNGAVNNHVITLGVYDQTTNSMKTINAYYEMKPKKHLEMNNGNYYDVFEIEVEER